MRNGDRIGYEMWKADFFNKSKGIEDIVSADMLNSLIRQNVSLNFAITIDQKFEAEFTEVSKDIREHIESSYGDFEGIDEDQERYEEEVLAEVKSVQPFVDRLNDQLSISVQVINFGEEEKNHCYLALTFPNEASRQLVVSRMGGRKNFTDGPFQGRDCPIMDEKNSSMLKIIGVYGAEGNITLNFPDPEMASRLFNSLPGFRRLLGIEDYEAPIMKPLENDIRIPCPDYFLEYTQLLLVPQLPKKLNPGALYVQIEGYYQAITLQSRVVTPPISLDGAQIKQFRHALRVDGINIDFDHFQGSYQLNIAQNKSVFSLLKGFCPSPAAFTTRVRMIPIKTFYGHDRVPPGQAMSLQVVEGALRLEESKSAAQQSKQAQKSLIEQFKVKVDLEVSRDQAVKERDELKRQLESLPKPRAETVTNGGCSCFFKIFFNSKQKAIPLEDEKTQSNLYEVEEKRIALTSQYRGVNSRLEQLGKKLDAQEQRVLEATREYTLFRERQQLLREQPPRSSSSDSIASPSKTTTESQSFSRASLS